MVDFELCHGNLKTSSSEWMVSEIFRSFFLSFFLFAKFPLFVYSAHARVKFIALPI